MRTVPGTPSTTLCELVDRITTAYQAARAALEKRREEMGNEQR